MLRQPLRASALCALIAASLLGAAACSTLDVHTDHDPNADFSRYRTYAWIPSEVGKEATDISGVPNVLLEKRIRTAVDSQLAAKGMQPAAEGETPDLLIRNRVTQKEVIDSTGSAGLSLGYGSGPWGGFGTGFGFPIAGARQYTEGTLVLDFIDSRNKNLVWRGIATDSMESPEESQEVVNETVAETLERYPPA